MHKYAKIQELKRKSFAANSQDMNLAIGIKFTMVLETKRQECIFCQIMSSFLEANARFLNPGQDRNLHKYDKTQELKKKTFESNSQKIKEEIRILAKYDPSLFLLRPF